MNEKLIEGKIKELKSRVDTYEAEMLKAHEEMKFCYGAPNHNRVLNHLNESTKKYWDTLKEINELENKIAKQEQDINVLEQQQAEHDKLITEIANLRDVFPFKPNTDSNQVGSCPIACVREMIRQLKEEK